MSYDAWKTAYPSQYDEDDWRDEKYIAEREARHRKMREEGREQRRKEKHHDDHRSVQALRVPDKVGE